MILEDIIKSWACKNGNINSTKDLLSWIEKLNLETRVSINEGSITSDTFWFYDDYNGEILNRKRSFFSIKGLHYYRNNELIFEQPMIFQPEIGYLGIICKEIDGVLNFLMQAKIEPGNINCVQISPTIQATKSNFTRAHGGKLPAYFEYFEKARKYEIIYDQIQSEQGSRFYKKRNRNIIIKIEDDIEVLKNFKWMTLGQIKNLMEIDNLVNMDTRTVLSGIPFLYFNLSENEKLMLESDFNDKALYKSIFEGNPLKYISKIYSYINDYKMFDDLKKVIIPLNELINWTITEKGVYCKKKSNFDIKFYDIEILGREVQKWSQPLFRSKGMATFGLATCLENGKRLFLIKLLSEPGYFDLIEIAPTVQMEFNETEVNPIEKHFLELTNKHINIIKDVILSEEGGRFYHEQNRNIILMTNKETFGDLPENYIWVDYATLNYLIQVNNCLNIQLRNLLSLLDI